MDNLSLIDANKPEKVKDTLNTLIGYMNDLGKIPNITKESIGLGNVDNTSDANKPISTPTKNYVDEKTINKVDKVANATNGNFVAFGDNGEIVDSGVATLLAEDNQQYIDNGDAETLESAQDYTDEKIDLLENNVNTNLLTITNSIQSEINSREEKDQELQNLIATNSNNILTKVNKVQTAIYRNFAMFNTTGGIEDSGVSKDYIDNKISDLVNSAPETLDTLGELATAIQENDDLIVILNNAIANKVDKVAGKSLSTNDYTTVEKNKLADIETGAQVNAPVDSALSTTSTNAVQNKVITTAINTKLNSSALLGKIYPVGSIYMSVNNVSPASFLGGTWTPLEAGRTLWTTTTAGQGGTPLEAGLPNIMGLVEAVITTTGSGALVSSGLANNNTPDYFDYDSGGGWGQARLLGFDASESNSIYGNSTTVQPPAIRVYMWRRTA